MIQAKEIISLVKSIREGEPNAVDHLTELCPRLNECRLIVKDPSDAKALFWYVNNRYEDATGGLPTGGAERTEILISSSNTNDLKKGRNTGLPLKYSKISNLLNNDLVIYGFKYVEPGTKTGMFYGGLMNIKGRWILIPKMWLAFIPDA